MKQEFRDAVLNFLTQVIEIAQVSHLVFLYTLPTHTTIHTIDYGDVLYNNMRIIKENEIIEYLKYVKYKKINLH